MRGGQNTLAGSLGTTGLARSKEPYQTDGHAPKHRFAPLAGRGTRCFARIVTAVCEHATCMGEQGYPLLPVASGTVERHCGTPCPS